MKILLTGSKEYLARYFRDYLLARGHEAFLVHSDFDFQDGEFSYDELEKNDLWHADVVINFPKKQLINLKKGAENFKKEFTETRIEPTRRVKEAILKATKPPKIWISFSSVSCYPKDQENFYKEDGNFGSDLTASLVRQWEEAACLKESLPSKLIIPRVGLILNQQMGLLPEITPLFRWGLGSIIGHGSEAFPWIYYKDLCMFLMYVIENEIDHGVYNTVAPQMITSKMFSVALAQIMQKKIRFKLPTRFFEKKLGDVAEIVLAKAKVYPSRLLKTGFNFRYPAIYPALVDAFSSLN